MAKNRQNKKTGNWAQKQNQDAYVKQARNQGVRARSYFKLQQIDKKYRLLRPGINVIDLGSSPGSWSEYAITRVNKAQKIFAVDLLLMEDISRVNFIQGDFTDVQIQDEIIRMAENKKFDLVLSDMAPNITGIRVTDQARAEEIQYAILAFLTRNLNAGGNVLTKIFEGEAANEIKKRFKSDFKDVQVVKPDASRSESREIYLLARGYVASSPD